TVRRPIDAQGKIATVSWVTPGLEIAARFAQQDRFRSAVRKIAVQRESAVSAKDENVTRIATQGKSLGIVRGRVVRGQKWLDSLPKWCRVVRMIPRFLEIDLVIKSAQLHVRQELRLPPLQHTALLIEKRSRRKACNVMEPMSGEGDFLEVV